MAIIANNNIPKSKFCVHRHNTVWFNDTRKEAIKKRKQAQGKLNFHQDLKISSNIKSSGAKPEKQ